MPVLPRGTAWVGAPLTLHLWEIPRSLDPLPAPGGQSFYAVECFLPHLVIPLSSPNFAGKLPGFSQACNGILRWTIPGGVQYALGG